LALVESIIDSDHSSDIHGGVFLSGFLVSDVPEFELGQHTIRVVGTGEDQFEISYTRAVGYPDDAYRRTCSGDQLISTFMHFSKRFLGLDLKMKRPSSRRNE
jgi:hypothetical protein